MTPLSLTGKRWILPGRPADADLLRMLRARRGLASETVEKGIPGMDVSLLPDLPKAQNRIRAACRESERIALFGDYDCDGITATLQILRFLRRRGIEPLVRLPNRSDDGYGLKERHVEVFAEAHITLLLTIDTGITARAALARAAERGIDVIVLDHHVPPEVLPPACALLHPALATLPLDPHPSAAGLAWSVISALEAAEGAETWEGRGLDLALAAIGTVADLVPLLGCNRTLVEQGIRELSLLREGPLWSLLQQAGLSAGQAGSSTPLTSRDIAFRIAPRLNAAGRMADPMIALRALLGDSSSLHELENLNRERQEQTECLLRELLEEAKEHDALFLCFASPRFPPGIAGLLAGKLTDRFAKPSLVGSVRGDVCTCSLRSIPGYDITAALKRQQDLLLSFGGHAQAAGCTLNLSAFETLHARLGADLALRISREELVPSLSIDACLAATDITLDLCEELGTLEPFGQGNPEPRFLLQNIAIHDPRCVGRDASHLQASVQGRKLIGFGLGPLAGHCSQLLDLVCRIGIDEWNGRRAPQLFVEDMRVAVRAETAVPGVRPL